MFHFILILQSSLQLELAIACLVYGQCSNRTFTFEITHYTLLHFHTFCLTSTLKSMILKIWIECKLLLVWLQLFLQKFAEIVPFQKYSKYCQETLVGFFLSQLNAKLISVTSKHNMSSSCGTCTKEIWAAFFRQTIWAGLEWFLAASPTATVQVSTEKVKPNILSLIFCSWKSL